MDTFTPQCSTCWLPACNRGCDNEAKDPGACEVTSMAVQPQPVERPWVRFYDDGVPAHLTYPEILLHHILEESARKYARLTALTLFGRQIEHQLKDAGVEVAVTLSQFFPRVAAAAGRPGVRHVVFTGINEYMPPHLRLLYPIKAKREGQWVRVTPGRGVLPFSALLAGAPPQPVAVSPDDPPLYPYTGGTTGGRGRAALRPYLWHDLGAELLAAPGHGDHSGPALRSGDGPARRAPPPADGVSRRPHHVLHAVEPRETGAHGHALHPDLHQRGDGPAAGGAAPLGGGDGRPAGGRLWPHRSRADHALYPGCGLPQARQHRGPLSGHGRAHRRCGDRADSARGRGGRTGGGGRRPPRPIR